MVNSQDLEAESLSGKLKSILLHSLPISYSSLVFEPENSQHDIKNNTAKDIDKIDANEKSKIKFKCDVCGINLITRTTMNIHTKLHNASNKRKLGKLEGVQERENKIDLKCDVCGIVSSSESRFKIHRKIHEESFVVIKATKYKFKCIPCKKNFNQLAKLLLHRKSHPGKLPGHLCHVCLVRKLDLHHHYLEAHSAMLV